MYYNKQNKTKISLKIYQMIYFIKKIKKQLKIDFHMLIDMNNI